MKPTRITRGARAARAARGAWGAWGARVARAARGGQSGWFTRDTRSARAARAPIGAPAFALVIALAFALALFLSLALEGQAAFAEEASGNIVDPTQRADNSFIYDTTIESLFDQASLYDDRTVQVVGEVVGDRIETNDGTNNCWVMLTSLNEDNSTSISVLLSAEQAGQIDRYGRYGVTGTKLQVRGTYHQACDVHDGLPDIHATNSSVLAKGVDHPDQFSLSDFGPGMTAIAIGLALMAVFYFARERMR